MVNQNSLRAYEEKISLIKVDFKFAAAFDLNKYLGMPPITDLTIQSELPTNLNTMRFPLLYLDCRKSVAPGKV